jgi:two-component system, oxyanion-binding sensor
MMVLKLGFLPLTDAAPLIVAHEKGFAAEQGLALQLERETSWSSLRDRIAVGQFDGGQMLAPLAVATVMGLSHVSVPLKSAGILNLNGNAITVSQSLAAQLGTHGEPMAARAARLVAIARTRAVEGKPITLATVFRFSCHTLLLQEYLALGGGSLADIELVVLPPSLMVEGLDHGIIDGFCAGSPWNTAAVASGKGVVVAAGNALVPLLPEKLAVLTERVTMNEPAAMHKLKAAIKAAGTWCAAPAHWEDLARLLSAQNYLNCPADLIRPTLLGRLPLDQDGFESNDPDYLVFDPERIATVAKVFAQNMGKVLHAVGVSAASERIEAAARMIAE